MDKVTQLYYHLQLAHDLILFLMHIQNDSLSQEQKRRRTDMILESWKVRVESNLKKLNEKNIKNISELPDADDLDVLKIMADVHSIEMSAVRAEFKQQVSENVIKSYEVK